MSIPVIELPGVTVWHGDCIDVMRRLPDNSIDAIVTDPPYGLEFMGKAWDSFGRDTGDRTVGPNHFRAGAPFQRWCESWAVECLRVLKPGGHMLAFGGTRTWHRLAVAVEDAGFEIRDSIAWLYGSGFPKSLDVGKAIDKLDAADARLARARRAQEWLRLHVTPQQVNAATDTVMGHHYTTHPTQPVVPTVTHLDALRPLLPDVPAWLVELAQQRTVESETFASRAVVGERKAADRRSDGTVVGLGHSGNANITAPATDAARQWDGWGTALKPAFEPVVVARKPLTGTVAANVTEWGTGGLNIAACRVAHASPADLEESQSKNPGRDDVVMSAVYGAGRPQQSVNTAGRWPANVALDGTQSAVVGEPERFFPTFRYQAKAPTRERPFYVKDGAPTDFLGNRDKRCAGKVAHPTVKPLTLMRWLIRLVTPPGGTVLDPFAGSGTTLEAAALEGFTAVGIEREADYLPLILQRLTRETPASEAVDDIEVKQPAARPSIAEDQPGLFDLMPGSDND